jgi:RNA polymerase sigma-70 factor (ECF subfamily)
MKTLEDSFASVYIDNQQKIYRLCLGYTNADEAIAEDLTQEIFIKVWENLKSFKEKSNVSTWIYRIAVNTCLMHIRARNRSKIINPNYKIEFYHDQTETKYDHEVDVQLKKMYGCIYKLPKTERLIILMVLEGLSNEEISNVLGISNEAIRVRIHRIKKKLITCTDEIRI